ncbi:MAG: SHOCT domain-containing protein [Actinomycetota bacterium]|nr:SHOCT domain-containing protein [Actinomycetota bacterium]
MTFWQIFLILAIFVPLIMLWVFTLVDVFQRPDLSGIAKALWAIAVVLLPLVGMLVYFILRDSETPAVDERLATAGPRPTIPDGTPPGAADVADQLERLADLRDKSILTDDEFQREKDKLLGSTSV